jgi:hypothetical protein
MELNGTRNEIIIRPALGAPLDVQKKLRIQGRALMKTKKLCEGNQTTAE